MAYRIRGTVSEDSRLIILKESDWSEDYNDDVNEGAYTVDVTDDEERLIFARALSSGWTIGYGAVTPEEYIIGNFLDLGTGDYLLIGGTDGLLIS